MSEYYMYVRPGDIENDQRAAEIVDRVSPDGEGFRYEILSKMPYGATKRRAKIRQALQEPPSQDQMDNGGFMGIRRRGVPVRMTTTPSGIAAHVDAALYLMRTANRAGGTRDLLNGGNSVNLDAAPRRRPAA